MSANPAITASELVTSRLRSGDRIAVLGAGGWFGSSVLHLLREVEQCDVLPIASSARRHVVAGRTWELQEWSALESFAPTVVVGLAAQVPSVAGLKQSTYSNQSLTSATIAAAERPGVRAVVLASSGAAVVAPDSDYGAEKRELERRAEQLVAPSRAAVVARAWSVSGAFVRDASAYAFSDFVAQAGTGTIAVNAAQPTYRRYVDAEEFLAVCLARALGGWSGVIDSGGELVELGELAALIAESVRPIARVARPDVAATSPRTYASDEVTWTEACDQLGFVPLSLREQIAQALGGSLNPAAR